MRNELLDKNTPHRTILYGGGRIGKNVCAALQADDILVDFFIDENRNIVRIQNIPVIAPEQYQVQPDDIVILCMSYKKICDELEDRLKKEGVSLVLRHTQVVQKAVCPYPPESVDERACRRCVAKNVDCENSMLRIERKNGKNPLYFDSLFLLVTTSCSLCCKECIARVPEYRANNKRVDLELEEFKECWREFRQAISYVKMLSISGGEAFLYRDLEQLLIFLCDDPKIGVIQILTNGVYTPPSNFFYHILRNQKIVVTLDDYGTHISPVCRKKFTEFERALASHHVNLIKIDNTNGTWYSFRELKDYHRTEEENRTIFNSCCDEMCRLITQDLRFEMCGLPSRLRQLAYSGDVVDLNDSVYLRGKTAEVLRGELLSYLKKPFLTCCNFCPGTSQKNIVCAGVQVGQQDIYCDFKEE